MENKNETKETLVQVAKATPVKLIELGLSFFAVIRELVPAFLLAWSNSLRQKNRELEVKLEHAKLKENVRDHKDASELTNANSSPRDTIDNFLSK